jgi:hypothetical protein
MACSCLKNTQIPLSMKTKKILLASVAALVASVSSLSAQFSDNFDSDHTANWAINLGTGNNAANMFFDYSTVGIPSAPNSIGGSTRGVKLEANHTATGALTGVSVSPLGQSFTGDFVLRFDMWANFNGEGAPANGGLGVGGSGSTQLTTAGVGTTGTLSVHAGSANSPNNGVWFGATGDGNTGDTGDYRAYTSAGSLAPATGVFYAGTGVSARNDTDPYYSSLGGNAAPSDQVTLFPQQSGTTRPGAAGERWYVVEITKTNNFINYKIGNLDIAKVDASSLTLSTNIFLGQSDINTTVSTDPNHRSLLFGLIDNVVVTPVPEPSTYALIGMSIASLAFLRRRG